MIKVDLITGFLGAGKTTFIIKYAKYLASYGNKVGIIENDFGAINVDRLLLKNIESDQIEVEQIVGGNILDDYRRRFRTKLISMAMRGFNRIIVEPSGIYNAMEFFDILADDPICEWYIPGNVFTIVDAGISSLIDINSKYLLTTELANSSKIIFSKINEKSSIQESLFNINTIIHQFNCTRVFNEADCLYKPFDLIDYDDFSLIVNSGYREAEYDKMFFDSNNSFQSVFIFNKFLKIEEIDDYLNDLFNNTSYGNVLRVKGFIRKEDNVFYEINATRTEVSINEMVDAQEVLIVIGQSLNEELIKSR